MDPKLMKMDKQKEKTGQVGKAFAKMIEKILLTNGPDP